MNEELACFSCRISYARYNIIRKQRRWTTEQRKLYRENWLTSCIYSPTRRFYTADVSVERIKIPDDFSHVDVRARIAPLLPAPHLHSEVKESIASAVGEGSENLFDIDSSIILKKTVERLDYAHVLSLAAYLRSPGTDFFPFTHRIFWKRSSEDLQILCFASFLLTFPLGTNNKLLFVENNFNSKNSNEF